MKFLLHFSVRILVSFGKSIFSLNNNAQISINFTFYLHNSYITLTFDYALFGGSIFSVLRTEERRRRV